MPGSRRYLRLWTALFVACAAIVLACIITLRSDWLQGVIRARIVHTLEQATGGPVSMSGFAFDWRTLSFECRDLRARGIEIGRLQVALNGRAVLERKIDAKSVRIDRPKLDLPLATNGAAPSPQKLLRLQIARYEVTHGVIRLRDREKRFDLHGENLSADLRRDPHGPEYKFALSTDDLNIGTECCGKIFARLEAKGVLRPDSLQLDRLTAQEGTATLEASARLSNFSEPSAALRFNLKIGARELSERGGFESVRGGEVTAQGRAAYEPREGWSATGHLNAGKVTYVALHGGSARMDAESDFEFANDRISFQNVVARLLGGSFHGEAALSPDRSVSFSGRVDGIHLNDLAHVGGWRPLPWAALARGVVSGGVHAGLRADLDISPAKNPGLSGHLSFVAARTGFTFQPSVLHLPHTEIFFHGVQAEGLAVNAVSTDLTDLKSMLAYTKAGPPADEIPVLHSGGRATFEGTLHVEHPEIEGRLELTQFRAEGRNWNHLAWQGILRPDLLEAHRFTLAADGINVSGRGRAELSGWSIAPQSAVEAQADVALTSWDLVPQASALRLQGNGNVTFELAGTFDKPHGTAQIRLENGEIYSEKFARATASADFTGSGVQLSNGSIQSLEGDRLAFSGRYIGESSHIEGQLRTSRFLLSHMNALRDLGGLLSADARFAAELKNGILRPIEADGSVRLSNLSFAGEAAGNAEAQFTTRDEQVHIELHGDLRGNPFSGGAAIGLSAGNPFGGTLQFERIEWRDVLPPEWPVSGFAQGEARIAGKLADRKSWTLLARAKEIEVRAKAVPFTLRNISPVQVEIADGSAKIQNLELKGPDTQFKVTGEAGTRALDLNLNGALSLQVLRLFDTSVESASGESFVNASIRGSFAHPALSGNLQVQNGALTWRDLANGLSKVNGSIVFNQDRATIEHLTAEAGGGTLTLGGFVTFGGTAPLAYHLEARAQDTRLRYANGISATTNANLRLTGTSTNSLLSGTATVSRVVFNPSTDIGNVLTNFAVLSPAPANQKAFVSGLQLDVAIESAPNLQISTALSRDVEATIDLHLRGTPERPVLLGTVSVNQGDIRVFGGRYTINRGEISFQNAAHIEPVLDLDLQTQARGINVDITISGTFSRLNFSYRSDPPLEPRDIIALLTVGRTPQEAANVQTTQIANETSALQASPNSVLGQAIAPPSGRLSKLFGITNIKIDPLVQGITNTPQSRLTLEQQISRSITVTYVTNLEQTSEQIFRLEWAINRQYSIVAVRDDNGEFGIDFQYKKRFK